MLSLLPDLGSMLFCCWSLIKGKKYLDKDPNLFLVCFIFNFQNKPKLMKLCCETLKYKDYLDRFLEDGDIGRILRADGINGNRELAMVLLYEMIFGKGLKFFNGKLKQAARQVNQAVQDKVCNLLWVDYSLELV